MPEGAALSWSFSDIVIRRKGRLAFRYRVPGCSLLDQWPEAALCSRWLTTRRMGEDAPYCHCRELVGAFRRIRVANHSEGGCYSMTSSASSRSVCGIVSPSAFAVLRLTTSSNVVGCSTGRSAGLAPLRILST